MFLIIVLLWIFLGVITWGGIRAYWKAGFSDEFNKKTNKREVIFAAFLSLGGPIAFVGAFFATHFFENGVNFDLR